MKQETDNKSDIQQGMKAAFDYFDKVSSFAKSQPVNKVKQTAVNFLYEFVQLKLTHEQQMQFEGLFQQAKQMEKDLIVEAFYEGMKTNPFDPNRGRGTMYYNETYKKQ